MLSPPPDVVTEAVAAFVARTWDRPFAPAVFVPLGEDSWNYHCGDLWVSLRRDLRGHVPQAYAAAAELAANGLEFVLAPVVTVAGEATARMGNYPVVAFPYRVLTPLDGLSMDAAACDEVIAKLARLHGSRISTALPEEDFSLAFEADVIVAIEAGLRPPANNGPLSDTVTALLATHVNWISGLLAAFHAVALDCRRRGAHWCPTHGEPLPANLLRGRDGIMIADWGEAAMGPPERDFAHLIRTTRARPAGDSTLLEFYRLRWILSEIAEYASILLAPHVGHADDRAMVERLRSYLPPSADIPITTGDTAWTA
jgi:spectinomycin phosphotransferase